MTARNGLIYGIAGRTLFAFDPETREVKMRRELPFSGAIYNAMEQGPDGNLWGVASSGIFRIDPDTSDAAMVATAPKRITAGFAQRGGEIYFVSNAEVWRWTVPGVSGAKRRK